MADILGSVRASGSDIQNGTSLPSVKISREANDVTNMQTGSLRQAPA